MSCKYKDRCLKELETECDEPSDKPNCYFFIGFSGVWGAEKTSEPVKKCKRHRYVPTYWEFAILGRNLPRYNYCLECGKEKEE